jgi:hypothetical protein
VSFLGCGLGSIVIALALFIYMMFYFNSCFPIWTCGEEGQGYDEFCVARGNKYCCGGSGEYR